MNKYKSPFGQFLISPWITLVPCLFFAALVSGSLFLHQTGAPNTSLPIAHLLVLHGLAYIALCSLHYTFIFKTRAHINKLTASRDSNQHLAQQKTEVLREEIRQHKAARSELQRLATHDQLTGARNRRHFRDTLAMEIERFKRYRNNFSLLIIDLDNFQGINDTYGHDCGDFILQKFAKSIQQNLRQSDVFVRYGGQEFAIIATNTEADSAKRFAEKLCKTIETEGILHQDTTINITVSIGVGAPASLKQLSAENLVSTTENALRKAKSQGKNQAVCISALLAS